MTTFFPLTTPTGPVFYYVQILAKKGLLSERRGETNVVSVIGVFYPLQRVSKTDCNEWTDTLLWSPHMVYYSGDISCGKKWDYT